MRLEPCQVPSAGAQLTLTSRPSPNFGARRDGAKPDMVVLHYTAMQSAEAACKTLCNPETEVSAHYLIATDGTVMSLVEEDQRAWHAGAGSWAGLADINSRSIGIELDNTGFVPFSAPLMDSLETLLGGIMSRWNIPAERVIAHSDMAPGRKIDPGARFDWQRLARQGLAVWPETVGAGGSDPDWKRFLKALGDFGYNTEIEPETLLAAFRLRFNPAATGDLKSQDMSRAMGLQSQADASLMT